MQGHNVTSRNGKLNLMLQDTAESVADPDWKYSIHINYKATVGSLSRSRPPCEISLQQLRILTFTIPMHMPREMVDFPPVETTHFMPGFCSNGGSTVFSTSVDVRK